MTVSLSLLLTHSSYFTVISRTRISRIASRILHSIPQSPIPLQHIAYTLSSHLRNPSLTSTLLSCIVFGLSLSRLNRVRFCRTLVVLCTPYLPVCHMPYATPPLVTIERSEWSLLSSKHERTWNIPPQQIVETVVTLLAQSIRFRI